VFLGTHCEQLVHAHKQCNRTKLCFRYHSLASQPSTSSPTQSPPTRRPATLPSPLHPPPPVVAPSSVSSPPRLPTTSIPAATLSPPRRITSPPLPRLPTRHHLVSLLPPPHVSINVGWFASLGRVPIWDRFDFNRPQDSRSSSTVPAACRLAVCDLNSNPSNEVDVAVGPIRPPLPPLLLLLLAGGTITGAGEGPLRLLRLSAQPLGVKQKVPSPAYRVVLLLPLRSPVVRVPCATGSVPALASSLSLLPGAVAEELRDGELRRQRVGGEPQRQLGATGFFSIFYLLE
jgi:hypothetical protein